MRKTATIPRTVYESACKLTNPSDKLEFYETIFRSLFDDEKINYSKIMSEKVSIALAMLSPEIKKIQTKYENGRREKNKKRASSFFYCEQNSSENKQNEASKSEITPSDNYNNILYIKNSYDDNQSVNKSDDNIPVDALEKLKAELDSSNKQFFKVIEKIIERLNNIKIMNIGGIAISSETILKKINSMIALKENHKQIEIKLSTLKEKGVPTTKINYYISSLYNLAIDLEKNKAKMSYYPYESQKTSEQITRYKNSGYVDKYSLPIISRNYTKEELDSVFDNLDDICKEMGIEI